MSAVQENIYDHDECFNCQIFRKTKSSTKNLDYLFVGNGHALQTNKGASIESNLFYFFISPEEPPGHPEWFDLRSHDVVYLLLGLEPGSPMLAFEVVLAESTPDAPPYNIRYIVSRRDDLHIPAKAEEHQGEQPEEEAQSLNEELFDRLRLLGASVRAWLQHDRAELKRQVCDAVLGEFRSAPPPESHEGAENELASLAPLLRKDGGDYAATGKRLDGEIYRAITALSDNEQVVLLLPMVDVEDLSTDWDATEWAQALRTHLAYEWEEEMRSIILRRIELALAAPA